MTGEAFLENAEVLIEQLLGMTDIQQTAESFRKENTIKENQTPPR